MEQTEQLQQCWEHYFQNMHVDPFNRVGSSGFHMCVWFPPRSTLLSYSAWGIWSTHAAHSQAHVECLSEHLFTYFRSSELHPAPFLPISQMGLMELHCPDLPQHRPAPLTMGLNCVVSPVGLQLPVKQEWGKRCLLIISLRLGVIFSPWTKAALWGPACHMFRAPPLPCFGAALQHHFTSKRS